MHNKTAKEMWDTLENIHEGDKRVKIAKLSIYRAQFENLKMNDDEDIASFFLRVAEIVNNMKALGETIKEYVIIQNILRSLPPSFNPNVSATEEIAAWETLTMNQLLGNLTAYEMRLPQRKSNVREAAFKTENKKEEKEDICSCSDEEEAKFVRKLDRGSGKYKGKIPFKCFNCGRFGHYAAKCPHKKTRNQNQELEKTISKTW